ncbi:NAD(P)-binding protein [Lindgomyces ingoldianus]|uniref:NAD(P)-binding protein n=1 Tax=Lindgomyces ingoldianus TaxID=673940 RepID=A0ACB6Q921_9PLEO|nr:NAD(P)-binding protein [Lindgomyces ingoldianus]KAF2463397.1 NAD(P)-binding protein [Lindgomyces ingoldianus]
MPPQPPHILITGGSRGIGLSIAQLFALHRYTCTLISRNPSTLSASIASLPHYYDHLNHTSISGDVSSPQFWTSSNHNLASKLGTRRVHVLVNCAGLSQSSVLVRTSEDEVQRIMDTNLTSIILGIRYLLRNRNIRREGPSPCIINIASVLGIKGGRGAVAYSASKAGVLGLTRSLAAEVGPLGIRVNAIVPGYIDTDMTADLPRQLLKTIPLGRFGHASEIADAALFLARNQYANNCVINLDGGLSAT